MEKAEEVIVGFLSFLGKRFEERSRLSALGTVLCQRWLKFSRFSGTVQCVKALVGN